MKVRGLHDDADLYELVSPPDETMERFYVETLGGPSRKILELTCGSGRFALPLAKSGAQVTGGDLSVTMLAQARKNGRAGGVQVDFVELDMRNFELDIQFDCVLVAANSLLHLHTSDQFAQAFAAIVAALTKAQEIGSLLKPGGDSGVCIRIADPDLWDPNWGQLL